MSSAPPPAPGPRRAAGTAAHEADGDFVRVTLAGEIDLEDLKRCAAEAFALAARCGTPRLLFDYRRARWRLAPSEIYRLPDVLAAVGLAPGLRIAALHSPESIASMDARLWRQVLANRGYTREAFESEDDAIAWLRGG